MEEEKRKTVAELEKQRKAQQQQQQQQVQLQQIQQQQIQQQQKSTGKSQAELDEEQRKNEAIAIESLQQLSMPPVINASRQGQNNGESV